LELLVVAGGDPRDAAQPQDTVIPDGDAVLGVQLVGEEPVAQGRVVATCLVEDVDEVGVVPVPLGQGSWSHL